MATFQVLDRSDFPLLLKGLREAGYHVVGPTVRDGAIVYGEIASESDLPIGWTEVQEAGRYRLERRHDEALFGYHVGPQSSKKYLFPSRSRLWEGTTGEGPFRTVAPEAGPQPPLALLGMRACELAALGITDRVFLGGVVDPTYRERRSSLLRVAVECATSAPTCFCVSMGTGPEATSSFDLALTEVLGPGRHVFLVRTGTEAGAAVLKGVPLREALASELESRSKLLKIAADGQVRSLPAREVHDLLLENLTSPHWEEVAKRCLACGNCTMVCPTCFCSTTEEVPSLEGDRTERWRRWDSCFNLEFSQLHGSSVRSSVGARYRQWITHKLATWHDQFGSSGCVGCGRCVTWCPVGIDLTQEVRALQQKVEVCPPAEGGGT